MPNELRDYSSRFHVIYSHGDGRKKKFIHNHGGLWVDYGITSLFSAASAELLS